MATGALCTIRLSVGQHTATPGSPPPPPPPGAHRTEENVVEAGGHGVRLAPRGAAPLLQPAPACNPEQQQQHEQEEGAADRSRHHRGRRPIPCGPQGT